MLTPTYVLIVIAAFAVFGLGIKHGNERRLVSAIFLLLLSVVLFSVLSYASMSIMGETCGLEVTEKNQTSEVILGNVNITGNLVVTGCIQYNCSGSCVTLGDCI